MYKVHPNNRAKIYDTVALLAPRDLIDIKKIRVGREEDGGYVVADAFAGVDTMLSYGVGHDVSFEKGMAERGLNIFMFDHTVERPSEHHAKFQFFKEGISALPVKDQPMGTLRDHIDRLGLGSDAKSVLKVDIEGAEIGVFAEAEPETLGFFSQITVELHWLHRLQEPEFQKQVHRALANLSDQFSLVHVHANNGVAMVSVDGCIYIPDVIELTYVSQKHFNTKPNTTIYPTAIDFPNNRWGRDHCLHGFPFLPGSEELWKSGAILRSIELSSRASGF